MYYFGIAKYQSITILSYNTILLLFLFVVVIADEVNEDEDHLCYGKNDYIVTDFLLMFIGEEWFEELFEST